MFKNVYVYYFFLNHLRYCISLPINTSACMSWEKSILIQIHITTIKVGNLNIDEFFLWIVHIKISSILRVMSFVAIIYPGWNPGSCITFRCHISSLWSETRLNKKVFFLVSQNTFLISLQILLSFIRFLFYKLRSAYF